MPKIIISGCNGRMGQVVTRMCAEKADMDVVAGFDINPVVLSTYPVFASAEEFTGEADVIIDFSNPASLQGLLNYCVKSRTAIVICTTGHNEEQLKMIETASKDIPVSVPETCRLVSIC